LKCCGGSDDVIARCIDKMPLNLDRSLDHTVRYRFLSSDAHR
jgi:hypothetical protein